MIDTVRGALTNAVNGGYLMALAVSFVALAMTLAVPSMRIQTSNRKKTSHAAAEDGTPGAAQSMSSPSHD
jgi:hypothetical protein